MFFMVANQLKAAARLIDEEFMRGEHAAIFCTPNGRLLAIESAIDYQSVGRK